MNYYRGKTAIVTGGADGIGRALCLELVRRGAIVAAVDINRTGLEETADMITRQGGVARTVVLDVTDFDATASLVQDTAGRHGRLDFMFNNAGVVIFGDLLDLTIEDWRYQLSVNLDGVVHGAVAAYRIMAKQGFGHIINTASLAGLAPTPTLVPYTATKHAVVGLSASMRAEGRDLGVRVSVVCPGFVRTGMFQAPLRKVEFDDLITKVPERAIWPVEKAARAILSGAARNRAVIVFPLYARVFWWFQRYIPALIWRQQLKAIREWRAIRKSE